MLLTCRNEQKRSRQPVIDAVIALYPSKETQQKLVDEDNARYGKAVAKLGLALDVEDPINTVARRFEAPLDVASAAAETGMEVDEFRRRLAEYPSVAKSLRAQAVKGGTVQRDVFEDCYVALLSLSHDNTSKEGNGSVSVYASGRGGAWVTHCVALSADDKHGAAGISENRVIVFDSGSGSNT